MYIVWAKRLHVYPTNFFENQPINEICSHLSEKVSKGSNEGKGEGKGKGEKERAKRRKGGEEKKQWLHY